MIEKQHECCTAHETHAAVQHFLLPCPFKKLTGWDCPGCGFQRSTVAFVKGNYRESFALYPAMLPLYVLFITAIIFRYFPNKKTGFILKAFIYFCGSLIIGSYILKIYRGEAHQ